MKTAFLLILFFQVSYTQNYHSPDNRKLFADHLFCAQDYLRAIIEYEECLNHFDNDTISFKVALGYSRIGNYNEASERFINISGQSEFYYTSRLEYLKSKIFLEEYNSISNYQQDSLKINELKLMNLSNLLSNNDLFERDKFLFPFNDREKPEAINFYDWKKYPPYKSTLLAGVLSSIIPGSGKIYADQLSEGLTALVLNSLFAFLSYNNFKHDHNFRGWVFASVGAFFYGGNIYGSVSAAHLYNSKMDYEYKKDIKQFLESNNYFIEDYDFCN
ncbi:MAG: hypothetical protein MUO34_11965 [Ignavibacteriaceae bacterium]|nr:hypothetical protein [Ignavibacteriaceae bacterium]